jgi:hypothetical protein
MPSSLLREIHDHILHCCCCWLIEPPPFSARQAPFSSNLEVAEVPALLALIWAMMAIWQWPLIPKKELSAKWKVIRQNPKRLKN